MKRSRSSRSIEVKIGRFNEKTESISLPSGATVGDALEKAGISLGSSESLWVDGVKASEPDTVENGDFLQIVGKKEGGSK